MTTVMSIHQGQRSKVKVGYVPVSVVNVLLLL